MVRKPSKPKVVFVTDIAEPNTVAIFEAMAQMVDLAVVFCSVTATRGLEWKRPFEFLDRPPQFRNRVVGGLTIRRRSADATDYYLSPRIAAAIARHRPDAVISSGYSAPTAYAAIVAAALRSPLLIQSDGTSYSERDLNVLQRAARAALVPMASGCVANSELAARRFAELGFRRERIYHSPHSTRLESFWEIARGRTYEPGKQLELLTVGRLIPRKGVDRLLTAVRRARDLGEAWKLTIVGSGPEEDRLRRLAEQLELESVEWRGFVDEAELPRVFATADAFAFPTLDDPFGLVLLEAAASALPLIASPRGGATTDLVREEETGFAIEPDDVEAWAAALVRLARDLELRRRMGQSAHELSLDRTPEQAAAGYVSAVEETLARGSWRRAGVRAG